MSFNVIKRFWNKFRYGRYFKVSWFHDIVYSTEDNRYFTGEERPDFTRTKPRLYNHSPRPDLKTTGQVGVRVRVLRGNRKVNHMFAGRRSLVGQGVTDGYVTSGAWFKDFVTIRDVK